jgi:hypothetical protein
VISLGFVPKLGVQALHTELGSFLAGMETSHVLPTSKRAYSTKVGLSIDNIEKQQ